MGEIIDAELPNRKGKGVKRGVAMNITKHKIPVIAREESSMLYGIAILMMLYHHLFLSGGEYFSIFGPFQMTVAWACKICVAIYAFITGYGFCRTSMKRGGGIRSDLIKSILHLLRFYKRFWIVFAVTVPLFSFLGLRIGSGKEFITNLTGWQSTYNGSWWYIQVYIILVLAFPLVNCLFKRRGNEKLDIVKNILLCSCILALLWSNHIGGTLNTLCGKIVNPVYFAIYLTGYLCANISEVRVPEGFYALIKKYSFFLALLCLISCFSVRIYVADSPAYNIVDIVIIAPCIYSLSILLRKMPHIRKALARLGRYSIYMWLIHEFINTYFSSYLFFTNCALVGYLISIFSSLAVAVILSKIEEAVDLLGRHMRKLLIKKESIKTS